MTVLLGWIFTQLDLPELVTRATVVEWVMEHYKIKLDASSAGNYLSGFGLSSRTPKRHTTGIKDSADDLTDVAWNYVQDIRRRGVLNRSMDLVFSVDFTFDSKAKRRAKAYGVIGGDQPSHPGHKVYYTNAYLTVASAGKNFEARTYCFTCDPQFARHKNQTSSKGEAR